MTAANRRCADCSHAEPAVMDDGPVLECRLYPPTTVTVDGEVSRMFVQVDADDWCGQFDPAPSPSEVSGS